MGYIRVTGKHVKIIQTVCFESNLKACCKELESIAATREVAFPIVGRIPENSHKATL